MFISILYCQTVDVQERMEWETTRISLALSPSQLRKVSCRSRNIEHESRGDFKLKADCSFRLFQESGRAVKVFLSREGEMQLQRTKTTEQAELKQV